MYHLPFRRVSLISIAYLLLMLALVSTIESCRRDTREIEERGGGYNKPLETREIAKRTTSLTVFIEMMDADGSALGQGSGFVLKENQIVTNFHVIRGAASGTVRASGKQDEYPITGILACDIDNDLAIIEVYGFPASKGMALEQINPEVGDHIYVVGNPLGFEFSFSDGKVSGIRDIGEEKELIQITGPISPGSSGGPVVNQYGNLIGVVRGTIRDGQNLNFAVPAKYVADLSLKIEDAYDFEELRERFGNEGNGDFSRVPTEEELQQVKVTKPIYFNEVSEPYIRDRAANPLVEFSIQNNLPFDIKNVLVDIDVFDNSNNPVDNQQYLYRETIYSGRVKKVDNNPGAWSMPTYALKYSPVPVNKRAGYRVTFKVIYFEKL